MISPIGAGIPQRAGRSAEASAQRARTGGPSTERLSQPPCQAIAIVIISQGVLPRCPRDWRRMPRPGIGRAPLRVFAFSEPSPIFLRGSGMTRRAVLTGIGLVTPLGLDRESTWNGLLAGKSGIAPLQ